MSLTTISGPSNLNICLTFLMFGELLESAHIYIIGQKQKDCVFVLDAISLKRKGRRGEGFL